MNTQTLISNLNLEDETDRSYAAEDLGYTGSVEAITPLIERLTVETSLMVRDTIFSALDRIDNPEVIRQVAALLDSDDAFLRNQAVALLQRKGGASAEVLLLKMNDPDPDVRKFVLDAAAGISSALVDPIFAAAMRDQDVNIVIAALEHVGERRMFAFKTDVEQLFLDGTEPMLVCSAFSALLQIGDAASWQCILRRYPTAASVPGWELGWWIRALGEFGAVGEIEVFHEFLQSHDGKGRRDTIDALERFQARYGRVGITGEFWEVLRAMVPACSASEEKLQLLRVFGGFDAPPAIGDYLLGLLEGDDRLTKLAAIEALKRLRRPDLTTRLRERLGIEADAEVIAALEECEGKSR